MTGFVIAEKERYSAFPAAASASCSVNALPEELEENEARERSGASSRCPQSWLKPRPRPASEAKTSDSDDEAWDGFEHDIDEDLLSASD